MKIYNFKFTIRPKHKTQLDSTKTRPKNLFVVTEKNLFLKALCRIGALSAVHHARALFIKKTALYSLPSFDLK